MKTLLLVVAVLVAATSAVAGNGVFTGNADDWSINDQWSDYATGVCQYDGNPFGIWEAAFDGGGCTQVTAAHKLELTGTATTASLVYSAHIQGDPSVGADVYLDVKLKTVQQLRTATPGPLGSQGSSGGPFTYEVGWVTWNGRFDSGCSCYTFNYFLVKPTIGGTTGGYELGVVYNNGGVQGQRFLATGSGNYAINTLYDVEIWHANATQNGPGYVVTVKVNGTTLVNAFADTNHYMFSNGWALGLYEESAKVDFSLAAATRL
jgi:hypothetical protein